MVSRFVAPWTRRALIGLALVGAGVVAAAPAAAQDAPAACEGAYSSDQLVLDVQELEAAVIDEAEKPAITLATAITGKLPCVEQKLPLGFLGRVYRALAGGYYVAGDGKISEAWFRTALEIDRGFRYGLEDLPGDHPLRQVYASMLQAEEVESVALQDKAFIREGTWFLDGRAIDGPVARPGRPHVLQLETPEGEVETWLIQGNGFPADILEDGKNVADKDKKRKKDRDRTKFDAPVQEMGQGAVLVPRSRPPEQFPLLLTGGSLIAGGVALAVGSFVSRQNFATVRNSEDDLRRSQQATNRLALGAVAAAALGAGTMTYGIIIDDAGRPAGGRVQVRFR